MQRAIAVFVFGIHQRLLSNKPGYNGFMAASRSVCHGCPALLIFGFNGHPCAQENIDRAQVARFGGLYVILRGIFVAEVY